VTGPNDTQPVQADLIAKGLPVSAIIPASAQVQTSGVSP